MRSLIVLSECLAAFFLFDCLTGCAYVNPYVLPASGRYCDTTEGHSTERHSEACKQLINVARAVNSVSGSVSDVKTNLDNSRIANRALGGSTFALVTALAVKTAHGGPPNALKNLGLGAAAVYAGSSLFSPVTTESLYLAAHSALVCITNRGEGVLATYDSGHAQYDEANSEVINNALDPKCSKSPVPSRQDTELIDAVRNARRDANAALQRARTSDASIGLRLTTAANNLLGELNRQLLTQSPSVDAIMKAARSESSIPTGAPASGTTAPQGSSLSKLGNALDKFKALSPESQAQLETCTVSWTTADLQKAKSAFEGVTSAMSEGLNAIGDLSTGCSIDPIVKTTRFTAHQTQVDLQPGGKFDVLLSGGRPPYYSVTMASSSGSDVLAVDLPLNSAIIHLKESDAGAEDEFTVLVQDSGVVPNTVSIVVKTHGVAAKATGTKAPADKPAGPPAKK